jgi:hypothetical protein
LWSLIGLREERGHQASAFFRVAAVASSADRPPELNLVSLKPFPGPYRGMLSICSDIDQTTPERFVSLHRYFNTREMTPLGQGLGLDISDSFWFYSPQGKDLSKSQMSFFAGMNWQQRSPFADQILDYIRGGWIDTLHSYGNFNHNPIGRPGCFSRTHAARAFAVLDQAGVVVKVWSNHGNRNNIQNIGQKHHWLGDRPGNSRRHTDLMRRHGIRFVWSGFMSAEFRQNGAVRLDEFGDSQKVWQFSRHCSIYFSNPHGAEDLAQRFGAKIARYDDSSLAVVWHPRLLHVQLSQENLAELAAMGGYAIVGQHLGAGTGQELLSAEAVAALQRLKAAQDEGNILITRTSRLLEYAVAHDGLQFETTRDASGKTVINILGIDDPVRGARTPDFDQLRGITFEVCGDGPVELRLFGRPVAPRELDEHQDLAGCCTIGIRWFPQDHTDYAYDWELRSARR